MYIYQFLCKSMLKLIYPDLSFLRIWQFKAYTDQIIQQRPQCEHAVHLSFLSYKKTKKHQIYKGYE